MRQDQKEALRALPLLRNAAFTDDEAKELLLKIVDAAYRTGIVEGMKDLRGTLVEKGVIDA